MKKSKVLILFLLLSNITQGQSQTPMSFEEIPEWLYKDLKFEMPHVRLPEIPLNEVSIASMGAKGDGITTNTVFFQKAIDMLDRKGGGTLIIPRGIWLTGPIQLVSNLRIHLEKGAVLLFSRDFDDYWLVQTSFEGLETVRNISPISGRDLTNVAITGEGVIDGNGDAWRMVKKSKMTKNQWEDLVSSGGVVSENGKIWFPTAQSKLGFDMTTNFNVPPLTTLEEFEKIKDFLRPVMISLINCERILLDGPTFQNSPAWNIHPLMCEDVTIRNLNVRNPWYSQNGDGLDLESCRNVVVYHNTFDVGDDAICIKSGKGEEGRKRGIPSENIVIRENVVYHGHGGVVVGSEMSGGVRNIHTSECTFIGTDVGIRFKTTRGRGGLVENIWFSNMQLIDIPTDAIRFNLFYTGKAPVLEEDSEIKADTEVPLVTEETPSIRNIFMDRITVNGAGRAVYLLGLPEMNLQNIHITNSVFRSENGLTAIDVDGLLIRNSRFLSKKDINMIFYNGKNVTLEGVSPSLKIKLMGPETSSFNLDREDFQEPKNSILLSKNLDRDVYTVN